MSIQDLMPLNLFPEDLYLWSAPIHIPECSCIDLPWSLNTYTLQETIQESTATKKDDKTPHAFVNITGEWDTREFSQTTDHHSHPLFCPSALAASQPQQLAQPTLSRSFSPFCSPPTAQRFPQASCLAGNKKWNTSIELCTKTVVKLLLKSRE